jgi:hypothetical protein
MEIPVLIEPVPGIGFRASGGEPFAIVVEGETPEAALAQFKEEVSAKLHNGAKIASVTIQPEEHPWLEFAGMFDPEDPLIQEWLAVMKEQRDREDTDEE